MNKNINIQPIIKWSGSKRSQSNQIVSLFPKFINVYYEPFIGSASILIKLIQKVENSEIKVGKFECSDINFELIQCWNFIKNNPDELFSSYVELYNQFSVLDIDGKKSFYNQIKSEFNELNKNHFDNPDLVKKFFWLRRTAFNGLVRYNSKGEFNAPCHFTRNGIEPQKLKPILFYWSEMLNKHNVHFSVKDYKEIVASDNDFIYLDPPYAETSAMYSTNSFNETEFFDWIRTLNCNYILSYNGDRKTESTTVDNTVVVPENLYTEHLYLEAGKSSFNKFNNIGDVSVRESLYIKRNEKDKTDIC